MCSSFPYFQGLPGFKGSAGYLGEEGIAVSQVFFPPSLIYSKGHIYNIKSFVSSQRMWEKLEVFPNSHRALLLMIFSGDLLTYCLLFHHPPTLNSELNAELIFLTRGVRSLLFPPFLIHFALVNQRTIVFIKDLTLPCIHHPFLFFLSPFPYPLPFLLPSLTSIHPCIHSLNNYILSIFPFATLFTKVFSHMYSLCC